MLKNQEFERIIDFISGNYGDFYRDGDKFAHTSFGGLRDDTCTTVIGGHYEKYRDKLTCSAKDKGDVGDLWSKFVDGNSMEAFVMPIEEYANAYKNFFSESLYPISEKKETSRPIKILSRLKNLF